VQFFTFLACGLVLTAVGGLLFYHHLQQMRSRLNESANSTARIIADNTAAALAFRDETAAGDILSSLRYDPLVVAASLYALDGQRFVSYGTALPERLAIDAEPPAGALTADVVFRSERLGRLIVVSDVGPVLRRTMAAWAIVFSAALVFAALLALLLARRFQRVVAAPLVSLSRTAEDVTRRGDYSLRAEPGGSPEVMALARAFNAMLAELGHRGKVLDQQVHSLNAEIRQRLEAEESLRQNTREMLRISHRAGVAEVATGVLHNIGNALNSINVSAELLDDSLRRRARESIARLHEFFTRPPEKAATVFLAHPDGEALRLAVVSGSGYALGELDSTAGELESLRLGVAHLKDIVARQQSLARTERQVTRFDLASAVEQAIVLDQAAGRGAGHSPAIKVSEISGPLPPVCSDQGAIEQILINLLANAREAVAEAAPTDPAIWIDIGPASATHLPVTIRDNGVGIPADRLVSIFSYGFTTKPGGHGFGLHNAANLARLLGGSLRVQSEGAGRGAAFTLEVLLSTAVTAQ
jgi:C4-dicarboxylate-specific signal transduction histidine kinase